MSQHSESDLRAALRFGEEDGPGVDVGRVIAGAQAARARRTRMLATAAAVVLVAGIGTTVGLTWPGGSTGSNTAGSAGGAYSTAKGDAAGSANGANLPKAAPLPSTSTAAAGTGAAGVRAQSAAAVTCPARAPHELAPGGGSPGQFGAPGPLFAKPVQTIVVCVYGPVTTTKPARIVLDAAGTAEVVHSLESASTKHVEIFCPHIKAQRVLAFVAVTKSGRTLPVVTATVGDPSCDVVVTNGTAVRYDWTVPNDLLDRLDKLPHH